jgi:hypothetical protein
MEDPLSGLPERDGTEWDFFILKLNGIRPLSLPVGSTNEKLPNFELKPPNNQRT